MSWHSGLAWGTEKSRKEGVQVYTENHMSQSLCEAPVTLNSTAWSPDLRACRDDMKVSLICRALRCFCIASQSRRHRAAAAFAVHGCASVCKLVKSKQVRKSMLV